MQLAEEAYILARALREGTRQLQDAERPARSALGYSLGICAADADVAASHLGGLCNELQELHMLLDEERARAA